MNKRIIRIDASSLKESACMYRWWLVVMQGYKEPLPYNDTNYGTAGHAFIQHMYLTKGNFMEALKTAKVQLGKPVEIRPKKDYLTEIHFTKTCFDFWQEFLSKDDFEILTDEAGVPLVELKFDEPYWSDENFEIRLTGTIDKLGKFKNGCYAIGDYKFTSSWNEKEYFTQYELSLQLMFYLFMLHLKGAKNPDSALGKIIQYPVGAFIDAIFLKSNKETVFKRSEVWFTDKKQLQMRLNEMKALLDRFIYGVTARLSTSTPFERTGLLNGACANAYGTTSQQGALCRFFRHCAAPDEIAAQHVLKNTFKQREYNPLKFNEE
jgi:hypothetical protein